jgi:hypothetical protein
MSYGRTGLILRVWAEVSCFNTVCIMYSESYETYDAISSVKATHIRHWFPSSFRAVLYAERINTGQLDRYSGTKYDCGFS